MDALARPSLCRLRHQLVFAALLGGLLPFQNAWGSQDPVYGHLPLAFLSNHGQVHESVRYMVKGPGMTAYFRRDETVIHLRDGVVRMNYVGANPTPQIQGLGQMEGETNFLIGADRSAWRTGIPGYRSVVYRDLYPGIDMVYGSQQRRLKSEFLVSPEADPSRIQVRYSGVRSIRIAGDGALIFQTSSGELREGAPEMHQEKGGQRVTISGRFRLLGPDTVGFAVGEYDRSLPLVIDPLLSYSTYLNGSGTDKAYGIAVDGARNAYVTGYTDSFDFPTVQGLQGNSGGSVDAFVVKLNPTGTALVYSTYLGGSGDDRGFSIAVDAAGSAYVTGWTGSVNFPTAAPIKWNLSGSRNAFVAKLNPAGNALVYSTYLGGSGADAGNGIAIDSSGCAYVTGSTSSTDFPLAYPLQGSPRGGLEAFITKISAGGSTLLYSTYLGGSADDRGAGIAVDSGGNAYVTGTTSSANFPTVAPVQAALGGGQDVFVAKVNASGSALSYSTYLGGSGTDYVEVGSSIAVDVNGSAYIAGTTASTNFPVFQPLQAVYGGGTNDGFVTKLSSAGNALVYSTFLGGTGLDYANAIAVDGGGYAHVAGYTSSLNFPTAGASQPTLAGGYDVFVARLNQAGNALVEGSFLGGSNSDAGYGIALDSLGYVYVSGQTLSPDFPLLNPIQSSNNGTLAAFVARFYFWTSEAPLPVSASPSSGTGPGQTFTFTFSHTHGYADINWVEVNVQASLSFASGCYLHYDRPSNTIQLGTDAGTGWVGSALVGSTGTLQNNQCAVDTGASSATVAGNYLTLNLSLAFKPTFPGTQNLYLRAANPSGLTGAWLIKGTWTVPNTQTPAAVSVTPSSGSGSSGTFGFLFSDALGYADISSAQMMVAAQVANAGACSVLYTSAGNSLALYNDAGTGFAGSAPVGTPGLVTNSQCSIDTGNTTVTGSGNSLTINLALIFKTGFAGAKGVSMSVTNSAGGSSGWQTNGAWTVTAGGTLPPGNVSVTPSSGSGSSQVFAFTYTDPYGYADINWVQMHIQTQLVGNNACYAQYTRATNVVQLVTDSGSGYAGSGSLGSPGTLTNSQCSINLATSSASGSGDAFTVNLSITFKVGFAGAKTVSMGAINNSNVFSGWQAKGNWTVTAGGSLPPSDVSVTPSSGSGAGETFSFVYSDPYGNADINWVQMHFQATLVAGNACYLQYTRSTNTIQLVADSGSGYAGSGVLGATGTLTNSQCTINLGASSSSGSGDNFTVNLALTFGSGFTGAKTISLGAINNSNVFSGWQAKGTYTITFGGTTPPSNVSVTPASGSGSSQIFTFVYSDPYGYTDINWVEMHFGAQLVAPSACYIQYSRTTNVIQLVTDAGTGYAGSATLGVAGKLTNSQCTIDAGASSVSGSGNTLTVNLSLIFKVGFAGAKTISMGAVNTLSIFSGWQAEGSWTATAGGTLKPGNVSVTPSSGAGTSQTFSFVYSDPYGYTDLNWVQMHFQTQLVANNACYMQYTKSTNTIQLVSDSGSSYAGSGVLGTTGTLSNSQCTINLASSSASGSGDNFTVNLSLAFTPAFSGTENISMGAINNANVFSGWQAMGTWTVQ